MENLKKLIKTNLPNLKKNFDEDYLMKFVDENILNDNPYQHFERLLYCDGDLLEGIEKMNNYEVLISVLENGEDEDYGNNPYVDNDEEIYDTYCDKMGVMRQMIIEVNNIEFLMKPYNDNHNTTIVDFMESTILKNMKFMDGGERVLMCGLDGNVFGIDDNTTNFDVVVMCGEDYINGLWCVEDFMDEYDELEGDEILLSVYREWFEYERNVLSVELDRFKEMVLKLK